ncbi:glutamine amidotransferase [Bryobacterales bacterium F-183]|nr:glutamine amidotransferase [Bryobacterales bacterium F-183]
MTRVLVLDNYDSFTWNLVDGLETAGATCVVHRSDAITVADIEAMRPDRIVLSPGPFGPDRAGICGDVVQRFRDVPMLGVCLGMQVMAVHAAGGRVVPSGRPVHGKALPVQHDGAGLFRGVPNPFVAARYHSLIVENLSWPVSAVGEDGTVLGFRSPDGLMEGVLFHPESFLTEHRATLFANFLAL